VITPGRANAQRHRRQTPTRRCPAALDKPLLGWPRTRGPRRLRLKPDHLAVATRRAPTEPPLAGVICAGDRPDDRRFGGAHDPMVALVACGANTAERAMLGGEWRVADGAPVGVDVARLRVAHVAAVRAFA
jgi:hypothetical protein